MRVYNFLQKDLKLYLRTRYMLYRSLRTQANQHFHNLQDAMYDDYPRDIYPCEAGYQAPESKNLENEPYRGGLDSYNGL